MPPSEMGFSLPSKVVLYVPALTFGPRIKLMKWMRKTATAKRRTDEDRRLVPWLIPLQRANHDLLPTPEVAFMIPFRNVPFPFRELRVGMQMIGQNPNRSFRTVLSHNQGHLLQCAVTFRATRVAICTTTKQIQKSRSQCYLVMLLARTL